MAKMRHKMIKNRKYWIYHPIVKHCGGKYVHSAKITWLLLLSTFSSNQQMRSSLCWRYRNATKAVLPNRFAWKPLKLCLQSFFFSLMLVAQGIIMQRERSWGIFDNRNETKGNDVCFRLEYSQGCLKKRTTHIKQLNISFKP